MKTGLYVPKVKKVEVVLTFLVAGLHHDTTEGELYDILEDIAKGTEGEREYNGRKYTIILEDGRAAEKRRT